MIPQGWQPIGEPDVRELSPDAKAVRDYIAENQIAQITHKTESAMCRSLHMGLDRLQDAVYEIRKMEAIRMGKLTNQQRAAIYQAWKDGTTQKDLAKQYGVCAQAISQLCAKLAKAEQEIMQPAAEDKPKPGIINQEFDDAVNQMIEEAKAPAEAVQEQPAELEPVIRCAPEKIPNYIWLALDDQCSAINLEIETRQERMAELRSEIEKLEEIKAGIYAWLDAHEVEGKA